VKKRQDPTRSKGSPHGASPPQPSRDEVKSAEEREAEAPETPAALECESEELPDIDEETKVVLLPVNPYLVHVYWGIRANDLKEIERVFRLLGQRAQPVLRFYDITHINFDGTNAHSWFDVEIDLRAWNWYVHLQSPGKSYCTDLGLRTEGGGFHRLARSNAAETPRAWPSDKVEESFLIVEGDYRRVERVVPPVESTDAGDTPHKPPWTSELARAEEIPPKPKKLRIFPRGETAIPLVEPADAVEAGPNIPEGGERYRGEAKESEPKELRFFRTTAPGESERIVRELYKRQRQERPGLAPNAPSKAESLGELQPPRKKRVDLTEASEKSFRAGISSGQE
jgi:hypothetical protein